MKIAVLSPAAATLANLRRMLEQGAPARVVTCHEGGMGLLRTLAEQEPPDVFIIEGRCHGAAELDAIEFVTTHYPHIFIIMLCAERGPELLMDAMRVGVREVLPSPVPRDVLEAAVARIEAKVGHRNTPRKAPVLAFIPSKGGSGATFLATNIGYQLAEEGNKVLLIDLNLQFGEAVLTLHDKKPESNIIQVAYNIARLDASFLSASVVQITPNYAILAAPDDPAQSQEVKPEHLEAILNLAVTQYDFVLLDVDRSLDDLTIKALDCASQIFLVVQTLMPYIRNANRLMGVFRALGYPQKKVEVLVNRFWKNDEIGLDQLRASLGMNKVHTIPNGYKDVAKAINLGVPLATISRGGPVFRAIGELVDSLQPRSQELPTGLLSRLLKH
jgi:pilus assembly protein CpaE